MGACSSKENSYAELGDRKSIWRSFINTKKNKHQFLFPSLSPNDWYYREYITFYGYMRENALYTIINDIIALILCYYDSRYTIHLSKNMDALSKLKDPDKSHKIALNSMHWGSWVAAFYIVDKERKSIRFWLGLQDKNKLLLIS